MKVAAYCRVSTEYEDQTNSFETQKRFFKEHIERNPDWELYEIYADEGLSGTSTRDRKAFNRMIADAKAGKFELILTKEVSRFARNTVDTLQYTRELKQIGVGVRFISDNINSMDPDAELRLTIMASLAQEESRKTSDRVTWGMQRKLEQGFVFGQPFLGYNLSNGVLTIEPEGAETVKLIYHKYLHERKGASTIGRELTEAGIPSPRGCKIWNASTIYKILRNEKYCGNLLQQKTYTPDYLTHEKKNNHGEVEQQFFTNHHEAIIDPETWQQVQEELDRRSNATGGKRQGHSYPLSGKIVCADCGRSLVHRLRKASRGRRVSTWRCNTNENNNMPVDENGNPRKCGIRYEVRTDIPMQMIKECLSSLNLDKEKIVSKVADIVSKVLEESNAARGNLTPEDVRKKIDKLMRDTETVTEKKKKVLDSFFSEAITKSEMKTMNQEYDNQLAFLEEQIADAQRYLEQLMAVDSEDAGIMTKLKKEVMDKLERMVSFEEAPDSFLASMVDHVKCYPDRTLEVALNILPTRWKYMLSRYSYSDKKEQQGPVSEPEPALLNNNVHRIASGPAEIKAYAGALLRSYHIIITPVKSPEYPVLFDFRYADASVLYLYSHKTIKPAYSDLYPASCRAVFNAFIKEVVYGFSCPSTVFVNAVLAQVQNNISGSDNIRPTAVTAATASGIAFHHGIHLGNEHCQ